MLNRNPKLRLTIDEILAHPWFKNTPKQKDVTIFNASEKATMIREYFFSENPMKWLNYVDIEKKELKALQKFDVQNLITMDSSHQVDDKNITEGSQVLAPNVSSMHSEDFMVDEITKFYPDYNLVDLDKKHEMIYFRKQARKADKAYERNHNKNVDNGVYKGDADH